MTKEEMDIQRDLAQCHAMALLLLMSPESLLGLLTDSSRTHEYNKTSLG